MNQLAMLRLFNLISPALPVGAFAYSQGLEWAIEEGQVNSPEKIADWITHVLSLNLSHTDIPVLARLVQAIEQKDAENLLYWNAWSLASRETQELLDEDRQVAAAMMKVLQQHGLALPDWCTNGTQETRPCLILTWALAATSWGIDLPSTAAGYCWSWAENQITVAGKTLPLGQTQAQKILSELMPHIERSVQLGLSLSDKDLGHSLPGWVMACAKHETQYSRLFRS